MLGFKITIMNWDDTGFLLSKNRYNENSLIAEIYTKDHGKISGIVFGGTSKKIKNYLQIGNQLYTNFNSKSENKIGYFKIEIFKAFSPSYFDDEKKLYCISAVMNLVKILTAESQKNTKIYQLINDYQNSILLAVQNNKVPGCSPSGSGFFNMVRSHTIDGTFCDPYYGGNQISLAGTC